jgi:hypothetical protein
MVLKSEIEQIFGRNGVPTAANSEIEFFARPADEIAAPSSSRRLVMHAL